MLTTAFGNGRFLEMAKSLAASLQLHSPGIPRALVTDSTDPELRKWFHEIIPYQPEYGKPFVQKLFLDRYSPWQETLYIDSDCLVIRPIDHFWDMAADRPFTIFGDTELRVDGPDWFMDTRRVLSRFGLEEVPQFNGGLYIFNSSPVSARIFERVRAMKDDWQSLGFHRMHNGGPNDEPMFAVALAQEGLFSVPDDCRTMRTLIRLTGRLRLNVLRGRCLYRKGDRLVEPAIIHFAGGAQDDYRYRREMYRLRLHFSSVSRDHFWARWLPDLLYSPLTLRNRCGCLLRALRRMRTAAMAREPAHV